MRVQVCITQFCTHHSLGHCHFHSRNCTADHLATVYSGCAISILPLLQGRDLNWWRDKGLYLRLAQERGRMRIRNLSLGTSLVAWWLKLQDPNAGGPGFNSWSRNWIPHATAKTWWSQINTKKKKKKRKNSPFLKVLRSWFQSLLKPCALPALQP